MTFNELRDFLDTELETRTIESFGVAICDVLHPAGVRALIQSLEANMPEGEEVI